MKTLKIHPATFFFFLILILTGYVSLIFPYVLAVLIHELAHAYIAKKCGYKLNYIWILPYGASLSYENFSFDAKDEIKIAIAGPTINILLVFICVTFWWLIPESYFYTYNFVYSNLSIAIFNLLPAFPLDGSRVFIGLMSIKNKRNLAFNITKYFNILISTIFCILFIISTFLKINFSYFTISLFLFIGIFESKFQGNYSHLIYEFTEKKDKMILNVKAIYVSSKTPVYKILREFNKHKFNIIYVRLNDGKIKIINELDFEKLLCFSSPKTLLEDLLK